MPAVGSSARRPCALAQLNVRLMRCLTRLAVSGLLVQMGSRILITSAGVISATGFWVGFEPTAGR